MRRSHFVCAALIAIVATAAAEERVVNVRTAGTQSNAAVAAGPSGPIVVWNSYYSGAGRSYDIMARRLDPNGEPLGAEFQVNQNSPGNQSDPAVAMNGDGRFVIAWQGPGVDQEDLYVRLYDPDGRPRSDVLAVNDDPNGRQRRPRVAMGADGAFVVVWENLVGEGASDVYSVRGRWFDSAGAPHGPSLRLDDGNGDARYPDIAGGGEGHSTVVWLRDGTSKAVFARLLDPNGAARTAGFEVSTSSFSSLTGPSVAMDRAGDFAIVWDGDPNHAGDDDVHGRCYDPNGRPKSEPFRVNAVREGAQQWPQVALNDANELLVVWQHEPPDSTTATDIFAQRLDGAGRLVGEPMQLNTCTDGRQRYPDVTWTGGGTFAAVWESENQDGSGYGVVACIVK